MRVVQNTQMRIGEVDISQIKLDPKSRDDIPQILKGLQHLYVNQELRAEIFELLQAQVAPKVDKRNGRPGMELWKILVCGVLRLDLNLDYDRLHELVNKHLTIREMLGHGAFNDEQYQVQTLKDNVQLLTPELLDKINQAVVRAGHVLVKKKADQALRGRCDSFVVETDVHYPTDISLLFDAMRKVVTLTARLCESCGLSDWRQHAYNVRHIKRKLRAAQNAKRSKAQSQEQKDRRQALIAQAHQEYLEVAQSYLHKARATLGTLEQQGLTSLVDVALKLEIEDFMRHATRQIDQTRRRVIEGQVIAHAEKVFSIFEPHTEWVNKVRREVAHIIVSPAHEVGDETGRSVGRSLPVHALLATAACEATGTTCRAFGPRRLPRGSSVTCQHQGGWDARLSGMVNKSELLQASLSMTSQRC